MLKKFSEKKPCRRTLVLSVIATMLATEAGAALAPVNLRTAGNFAVLAKSGISTVPTSAIVGDIGVSPIDSTAITGFSLVLDGTTQFSRSPQVTGRVFAADYTTPTPQNLTTAVSDMETAFTDAAGRTTPDHTELGAGNIGGLTLAPGLYKWGTGLSIPSNVILAGGPSDVWIFQVEGNITMAADTRVNLSGGAQAHNIFWQVGGGVGVTIGTGSHFEGIILARAGINLNTGASTNGRLLSQTAVTLKANEVTSPVARPKAPRFGPTTRNDNGLVTLTLTNTPNLQITIQHSADLKNWINLGKPTPTVSPVIVTDPTGTMARRFYRAFYP